MKKVVMIRFAMPVSKVLKNFEDLSFYNAKELKFNYLNIYYDGVDFIVENTILLGDQTTPRKVYVAKTNVAQWELDDTERESITERVPAKEPVAPKSKK